MDSSAVHRATGDCARGVQALYRVCKKMFAALPLGAVIGGATLVVHGGAHSPAQLRISLASLVPRLPYEKGLRAQCKFAVVCTAR